MTKEHIEIIKKIAQEHCTDGKCMPRSELFKIFQKQTGYEIEEYKFKLEISNLLKEEKLPGYRLVVGRKGGLAQAEIMENIKLITDKKEITGLVSQKKLADFISYIKE